MTDLVKRLRKIGSADPVGFNTVIAAADRIEKLEARIDEITTGYNREVSDRRRITKNWDALTIKYTKQQATIEQLQAEISKLRSTWTPPEDDPPPEDAADAAIRVFKEHYPSPPEDKTHE